MNLVEMENIFALARDQTPLQRLFIDKLVIHLKLIPLFPRF